MDYMYSQIPSFRPPVNNFSQISDLTPGPIHDDEWAKKELSTYESWTIRPIPIQKEIVHGEKWLRVELRPGGLSAKDIITRAETLNEESSVTIRRGALFPHQGMQVDNLLVTKNSSEHDFRFQWTLFQLERFERKIEEKKSEEKKSEKKKSEKKRKETISIMLFIKRAPKDGYSCMTLLHAIRNPLPPMLMNQQQHPVQYHHENTHMPEQHHKHKKHDSHDKKKTDHKGEHGHSSKSSISSEHSTTNENASTFSAKSYSEPSTPMSSPDPSVSSHTPPQHHKKHSHSEHQMLPEAPSVDDSFVAGIMAATRLANILPNSSMAVGRSAGTLLHRERRLQARRMDMMERALEEVELMREDREIERARRRRRSFNSAGLRLDPTLFGRI